MAGIQQRVWSLVPLQEGKPQVALPLARSVSVIGRDAGCDFHFPVNSISRRHAEIAIEAGALKIRDLGSRNGIRVNGVPRREAVLQHGDTIEVGLLCFQVSAGSGVVLPPPRTEPVVPEAEVQEPTARHRMGLSKLGMARNLSTLYHVCAWLAEDLEEEAFTEKCLRVLLEGLEALEVQLYDPKLGLMKRVAEKEEKAVLKLVPFLIAQFSAPASLPEATSVAGASLRKHQAAAQGYNLLFGPLRPVNAGDTPEPFVVIVRPTEWNEFTRDDRVLLQTICQLWVRALQRVRFVAALRNENTTLKKLCVQPRLLGGSETLETLRQKALKTARTNITVTLLGETGSGKEVVAHYIHQNSQRAGRPFVKVNCAAIPHGLIESELFGHVKGAFTDARASHLGKFEQAHGGTLFLDEIGELPLAVQSKFLRVLENGEIEKLGCEAAMSVDVRIIAASHCDLAQMVKAKAFREDLFYRLNALTLPVPPLRDHLEDIGEIADFFLTHFCAENGLVELQFSPGALQLLQQHDWPGNVRELRNVVQRCATHAEGAIIDVDLVKEHMSLPARP